MFEEEPQKGSSFSTDREEKFAQEKPGIELTEYSLVFFNVVETVLKDRGKKQLTTLLQNFRNACQRILEYCPGMSAFRGTWDREPVTTLRIEQAKQFVGADFFDGAEQHLFDEELQGTTLNAIQTQQILGTFFISSLLNLYREVLLQSLFQTKLRNLAEKLRENPLPAADSVELQGLQYVREIFQANVSSPQELQDIAQQQFAAIFQDLQSQNNTAFINLVRLFFLKPFPFEVQANAVSILQDPTQIEAIIADKFMLFLEKQSANAPAEEEPAPVEVEAEEERALIIKHATHIQKAFEVVSAALQTVKAATECTIVGEDQIRSEFAATIKKDMLSNSIFSQYFTAVHLGVFQKKDFDDVLKASLVHEKVQTISQNITQILNNSTELAPFLQLMSSKKPSDKTVAALKENPIFHTLDITNQDSGSDKFQIQHITLGKGKRRCCNPRDRETLSALLNANPLIEALLLSQIPIAVVLQILRLDDTFTDKDISTVMWFEPVLGLLGFACGVHALRNPKTLVKLVNTPVRILKALSTSAVVLSKYLEIAILVHTTLFPEEGQSGGMDLERFLTRIASLPMALALLSLGYNSISPAFKKRCCSKDVRRTFDFVNYSTIHWGLYQIIRSDIIKIVSRFEKPDFSSDLSKWLFEGLSAIPAFAFAVTRVAPMCASRRDAVGGSISETINTVALYGFTIALGIKLIIDLYFSGSDNLPIEQTNFRRVFFPILFSASTGVMLRFGRSFRKFYDGNPEVIIQKIPRNEDTYQPLLDDCKTTPDAKNALVLNMQEFTTLQTALTAPLDSQEHQTGRQMLTMYDRLLHSSKPNNTSNNTGNRRRCCVVS